MNKALVTAAGPNFSEMLACSEPTFRQFAETHDYDLLIDHNLADSSDRDDTDSRAARWAKVGLLQTALQRGYDLVVWMDADVMITQFDRDIAKDVDPDCFQALVMELFPTRFNPNSGVWAMRKDKMSDRFLEAILAIGQVGTVFADQGAICSALGWEHKKEDDKLTAKPVHFSEYLARTGWLPPEWNPIGMASKWPSRTQHFAGLDNTEKLARMKALYQDMTESGTLKV